MTQAELDSHKRLDEEQTQEEQRRIEEKERRHRVEKNSTSPNKSDVARGVRAAAQEKAEYDERKRQAIKDREALDKLINGSKDIERKANEDRLHCIYCSSSPLSAVCSLITCF